MRTQLFAIILLLLCIIQQTQAEEPNHSVKKPVPNFEAPLAMESAQGFAVEAGEKPILNHPIPSLQETRPGQPNVAVLTLQGSIDEAIRSATSVQKARGDNEITGEQLVQGYAEFLPNLVATAAANKTAGRAYFYTAQPTIVDTINHGPSYQISSTLNIFNGLNDISALRAALNRNEAAKLNLKRAKQEIALDVAQTYLQVVLDQQLVKIAKENLVASQARESLLAEQTRVGVRNLADLFRQQAQTSEDEAFLVNAESKERTDELLLLRKIRRDASQNYKILPPKLEEEASSQTYDDEDRLVKIATDNRPDLFASRSRARAAEFDVTSARSAYYPRLDFGATLGSMARTLDYQLVGGQNVVPDSQQSINDQLSNQVEYTIGLSLTWNIFDRWVTETNVERMKVSAHNASLDAEDRHNQVVAEIRQAFGDYRSVLQQLESTKKGLMASRKAYEVMQGRYQVGSASFVDLTLAQATLVQAEAGRAQAVISFALQTRTLETVLGTVAVE